MPDSVYASVPDRIETARLVLRRWSPSDAPALKAAIDANLEYLLPWIPWAKNEPSPLDEIAVRLAGFSERFETGPEWGFAVFDDAGSTLIGGIGLHDRLGPNALEIGYWIRQDVASRGYATEAAEAITRLGLTMGAQHLEIRCDPRNSASARVPEKLGYRHAVTYVGNYIWFTGEPRDTMVWVYPPASEPVPPKPKDEAATPAPS